MKKFLVLALIFIAIVSSADEMKKVTMEEKDYIEYKKVTLYDPKRVDSMITNAEKQIAKWQARLDEYLLMKEMLEK